MELEPVEAPIVAVTVFPDRARVSRLAQVTLPPGEHRIRISPLPLGLHRDSLRVSGYGRATVLGVDLATRRMPRSADERVAELTRRRTELAAEEAGLTDADEVEQRRDTFLAGVADRATGTYARALAAGEVTPGDLARFADAIAEQITGARDRRRELGRRRVELAEEIAAIDRSLQALGDGEPDHLVADVTLSLAEPAESGAPGDDDEAPTAEPGDHAEASAAEPGDDIEVELTYLVDGAGWRSSYDLRLVDQTLGVTWFGLVSQRTGEDWPECDLRLSTARPAGSTTVPELTPWYLDRDRPVPPPAPRPRPAGGAIPAAAAFARAGGGPEPAREFKQAVATVEQGVAAATYRPARAVAVPGDGSSHRATVAVFDLPARLDHVTAPVREPAAYLRATVRNTSAHTLLPGPAAVFHGADLVTGTPLRIWAPGEELELALGLDDRIRVERELVRREAGRATLGAARRREVEYRVTVANHTPRPAEVVVLDQLPVSRDDGIAVRETRLEPPPVERTDLGELTWRLRLDPGRSAELTMAFRVDTAKGVELVGWRE
ncbi:mucoidy inhibitor MuiA family protein [Plantactinospora siamensis]|uniref:Mucoidy inhibitor MuiA family protein n=1 Tax=Plantactinospora siamensis TaxID=555372 RepID=A0ABV6P069_9ACTN